MLKKHPRVVRFSLSLMALLAMYGIGSRALDTGSIGQWFLAFGALGWAFYQFVMGFKKQA